MPFWPSASRSLLRRRGTVLPGGGQGYVSTVAGLEPNVLGVLVSVLGGDDRLRLVQLQRQDDRRPRLRGRAVPPLRKGRRLQNLRSPATYLSSERDPAKAQLPASVDPKAAPRWQQVAAAGESFIWHDHRIHWTEAEPPPIVQEAPDEIHRIFRWRIPARADGERFVVSGFLGYAPPPQPADDDGISAWLLAALICMTVLVAVAFGAGARRVRRRAP